MIPVENQNTYEQNKHSNRIFILDEIRGFAVVCMVIYHCLYTFGIVFGYEVAVVILNFFRPFEPIFAALFIFISGICTKLSHSNLKRGIILFGIAIGINIFTEAFIPSCAIRFGVLNLLSISMIEYGLFQKLFERVNPLLGLFLSLTTFILTYGVKNGYIGIFNVPIISLPKALYKTDFLYPLGFKYEDFSSTDYFPIFPWFFIFMAGAYFSCYISDRKLPTFIYRKHSALFAFAGKYALYIYLIHQPLIFGIAYIISQF